MPTRNTYGVVLALVAVVLLFGGLGVAYQNAGYAQTETDHPTSIDYDNPSELPPERATNYSATVNITVDGTQLEEGSDYEWNASSGMITWLNSTTTSDGDTALVDYRFTAVSEETRDRKQMLSPVIQLAPWFALALGIAATWALVDGGGW